MFWKLYTLLPIRSYRINSFKFPSWSLGIRVLCWSLGFRVLCWSLGFSYFKAELGKVEFLEK
jgi:hypothetical protein